MELSFCITCMNRFHQISKTLLTNLNDNKNEKVEFVLVDFNSSDGLKEYILNNKDFQKYLNTKQLRYFSTKELIYWHASIAKNTAHKLAKGKYVVNLDCDNYIGKDGGDFLLDIFKNKGDNIIISQRNNIFGSGCAGRISLTKENFFKLGGYDEQFFPMGVQDCDLIKRAQKMGLENININLNNNCIINSKEESIKNIGINISYNKMLTVNNLLSKLNLDNNNLKANIYKNEIGIRLT